MRYRDRHGNWHHRLRLRRPAALALGGGLLALALVTPAAAPAAGGGKGPILAPHQGELVPAQPLVIRVRARSNDRIAASLNGRQVGKHFSKRARNGFRRLRASASHGLRHRRNVLRVKVNPRGKGRSRSEKVRFRVETDRPLAAAGVKRKIGLHARLSFDAGRSRAHPSAKRHDPRLEYRWRLVRAPRSSELKTHGRRPRGNAVDSVENLGPPPVFTERGSRTPHFRPDQPGVYKFQLNVTASDGARGTDTLTAPVASPPLVSVNTMAKPAGETGWGILVGKHFYKDPGNSRQWLQQLVLNPTTLEPISHKSYDCPEATANPHATQFAAVGRCENQVATDLAALKRQYPNQKLVVISASQRPDGAIDPNSPAWQTQPSVGLPGALSLAGGPLIPSNAWSPADQPMLRGRMSVIGFLGANAGEVTWHLNQDLSDYRDDGTIRGYLLRDNFGSYSAFASPEHLPLDTQAPGSTATHNVMKIGGGTFTADVEAGTRGGFHVVILDRQGLGGDSYFFGTGGAPDHAEAELNRMHDTIDAAQSLRGRHGSLVFVSSVGDARPDVPYWLNSSQGLDDAAKRVVDLLSDRVGATRNRVYRSLVPSMGQGARSYSLAGEFGYSVGAAKGTEHEGPLGSDGMNAVPLAGSLTRSDKDYGFELEPTGVAEQLAGPGVKLRNLAFSEPGSWPEEGNARRTSAIRWIGDKVGIDSQRSVFWNEAYNAGALQIKSTTVAAYDYDRDVPSADKADFGPAEFTWAKTELLNEIAWVQSAHDYIGNLAEPFTNTEMQQWANFEAIRKEINNHTTITGSSNTLANVGLVLKASLEGAGELLEPLGAAVGLTAALYDAVDEWSKLQAGGGDIGEPFSVTAGQVGVELANRMKLAQNTIRKQMFAVIAADYRKLRTVGLCASLPAQCPDPPSDAWTVSTGEQSAAENAITDGSKVAVYSALLPAKYSLWQFPESPNKSVRYHAVDDGEIHQPAGQTLGGWWCPFHNSPESSQVAIPTRLRVQGSGDSGDSWLVGALGKQSGRGVVGDSYVIELPDQAVTNPLFQDLGADPETFFRRAYGNPIWTQFIHYPYFDSATQWISKSSPAGIRTDTCGY